MVLLKPLLKPAALSNVSRLASQTAVYGVSTILGRLLNYLLIPLHTYLFEPASYGVVGELYAYITFLNVVYLLGMETAFFHFANKRGDEQRVFSTALIALAGTSVLFSGTVLLFPGSWLSIPLLRSPLPGSGFRKSRCNFPLSKLATSPLTSLLTCSGCCCARGFLTSRN